MVKIKKGIRLSRRQQEILLSLFAYSVKDINSYEELTEGERNIIDKSTFNQLTYIGDKPSLRTSQNP